MTGPDLTFVPIVNNQPSRLSLAQVDHYSREGFVQPFDVFSESEIAGIRRYFDRLIADMADQGAYGINCYQARMAGIWDLANEPRILDFVEDIIGRDIICWASAILSKRPHDPKRVPWDRPIAITTPRQSQLISPTARRIASCSKAGPA